MSHRGMLGCASAAAALMLALPLASCGTPTARSAATSTPSASPAASTAAPAQVAAADAAHAYLIARDLAIVAGTDQDQLVERLQPGSPAVAVEPLVATGRALLEAQRGTQYVDAVTRVSLGPFAFFQGAEPVTASAISPSGHPVTRAEVVCQTLSRLTTADGSQRAVVTDHIVTLVAAASGKWLVYEDDYVDRQQAEWLAAAGAPNWQVWAAHQRVKDLARVRRASATAVGAVRAFVDLLHARRYLEAGFCLGPGFGGTAQGVGATLRDISFIAAAQSGTPSPARTVLRVTLRVRPRLALWNEGVNVRFFTLDRQGVSGPWRITAIDTGP